MCSLVYLFQALKTPHDFSGTYEMGKPRIESILCEVFSPLTWRNFHAEAKQACRLDRVYNRFQVFEMLQNVSGTKEVARPRIELIPCEVSTPLTWRNFHAEQIQAHLLSRVYNLFKAFKLVPIFSGT